MKFYTVSIIVGSLYHVSPLKDAAAKGWKPATVEANSAKEAFEKYKIQCKP